MPPFSISIHTFPWDSHRVLDALWHHCLVLNGVVEIFWKPWTLFIRVHADFLQHYKLLSVPNYSLDIRVLASGYFPWAHHPMAGGRCLCITTNVSPRHLGAPACLCASHHWSFSFCCRPLWVTLHFSLQISACENRHWNQGGGCMIFVWCWWIFRCEWSCRHNWTTSPRQWSGGCQKVPTGDGVPPNCTEHCHWIWEDLQPCCSMGTSTPSLLHNSSRCGKQAHAAHGWQHWLGVCLCPIELGSVTHTSVQHGPHQHHGWWYTIHWPSWSTPPAPDV